MVSAIAHLRDAICSSPPFQFQSFPPVSVVENPFALPHNHGMRDWIDSDLLELARLYLQNERSFLVRRYVQRFETGEISAHEAVRRIRRCPLVNDEKRFLHDSMSC